MESPERLRDWIEAGKQVGKDFELERDGEYWIGGMAIQKERDSYVAYFWEVPERLCAMDEYVREERASFPRLEEALANDLRNGLTRGPIIVEALVHAADATKAAGARDPDLAMHDRRTQVQQDAARDEDAMCFEKGMDHALTRHSSQRPGEHHHAERLGRVLQAIDAAGTKAHA